MSGQQALRERAQLLEELHHIVQAMKNLAFAQLQRVARELPALSQARDAVAQALRSLEPEALPTLTPLRTPMTWLVIGAERGFCGPFNAHLADAVEQTRRENPGARILVAGQRLAELFDGAEAVVQTVPGCAASEEAQPAIDAWLARLNTEVTAGREVWVLHHAAAGVQRLRMLPTPDIPSISQGEGSDAPLLYLPAADVRAALKQQAARLALQASLYASLEQENRARLTQMQLAQDHLDELGRTLRRRRAALRQTEITNELETLSTSLLGPQVPSGPLR